MVWNIKSFHFSTNFILLVFVFFLSSIFFFVLFLCIILLFIIMEIEWKCCEYNKFLSSRTFICLLWTYEQSWFFFILSSFICTPNSIRNVRPEEQVDGGRNGLSVRREKQLCNIYYYIKWNLNFIFFSWHGTRTGYIYTYDVVWYVFPLYVF